jgi:uncharacterized glyoxalase superfamily protein PhnB
MIQNRSLPPGGIVPFLAYPDVEAAIAWLTGAFGFSERLRTPPEPDGTIHHAQVAAGQGAIVLSSRRGHAPQPGGVTLLVRVEDVDAHCERASRFGARILNPPRTSEFGERQYSVEDLAGYRWTFSQSVADVNPEEWGAIVHTP